MIELLHQLTKLAFYPQNIAKCKEKAQTIAPLVDRDSTVNSTKRCYPKNNTNLARHNFCGYCDGSRLVSP